MKKTAKTPAKSAAKPKAKVAVAKAPAKAPAKAASPAAVSAEKAKPAAPPVKVGWSEAIRNAMKEKHGHGPQEGNVWSGKRRAGSPALKNGTKPSNSG